MKTFSALFASAVVLALMTGCNSWTTEKCQSTNWETVGYSEGSQGKNNAAGVYASRCQKQKVSINTNAYNTGYKRGLDVFCSYNSGYQEAFSGNPVLPVCSSIAKYQEGYSKGRTAFCTYDNGYKRGVNGDAEGSMCSGSALTKYLSGYKKGRQKFAVEEVKNLKEDIDRANKDLDQIRDKIADTQYELGRIPKYTQEYSVIRLREEKERDLEALMRDRDQVRKQIEDMERQLASLERELK